MPGGDKKDWRPINPPEECGPREGTLPAYVANGLIGLRVREMALAPGMALVNGVVGENPERRVESAAPVPYPLAADICVNGAWLSDQPWTVTDLRQAYDFATGELTSRCRAGLGGVKVAIEVLTFASRTAPALVMQEIVVRPDMACHMRVRASVATGDLRGQVARRRTDTPGEPEPACDGALLWSTEGDLSTCGVALATETTPQAARDVTAWDATGPLQTTHDLGAVGKRGARLRQMAAMVPSLIHARPDEEAVRRVARAAQTGFDALRERNREAWRDLWRGRIVVGGARPEHQALIDAAFFYLNSSVHPASPSATSIFGLATWYDYHYYYGHVMWDIDAFCVPPLILSQPDAARAMLDFRSRGVKAAGSNARLSGRRGVQFPWEAAPLTGQEAAPGAGSAAAHEDHGSLHVARAFALFAEATGDEAFLKEDAWPVLEGVADWIVSRLTRTGRGWELKRAAGLGRGPRQSLSAGAVGQGHRRPRRLPHRRTEGRDPVAARRPVPGRLPARRDHRAPDPRLLPVALGRLCGRAHAAGALRRMGRQGRRPRPGAEAVRGRLRRLRRRPLPPVPGIPSRPP